MFYHYKLFNYKNLDFLNALTVGYNQDVENSNNCFIMIINVIFEYSNQVA